MNIRNIFFILLIAALLAAVFLNFYHVRNNISNVVYQIFYPFLRFFHGLSLKTSNFFYTIISLKDLIKENSELRRENKNLLSENVSLKETAKENEDLRKILSFVDAFPGFAPLDFARGGQDKPLDFARDKSFKKKLILADVIGYSSQNIGQYILINKGLKDGLKNDLAAVDQDGALVGRTMEVNDYFSRVLLITDPNSLVNAVVQNEKRPQGIIKGEYGLILALEMVSLGEKIEKGQVIITAGLGGVFPKGLLVGKIQEVIFQENEVFQKATVKPAVDFQKLERVFIML